MNELQFSETFKKLTGHDPLPWQWRLFNQHFLNGELCDIIDLPTGLGKTMVMAVWLIARETNPNLPRRLIYVVDRRTVVDQATDLAIKLRARTQDSRLTVSTLRGQLADNREWSRDLSRPAIIIGTVDLIGSALLFSGYRSSFRRRPLDAGLLGQDSLLVLDEAHLSKPFEKLVKAIEGFQHGQGSPMKVICMSATSGGSNRENAFSLNPSLDLRSGDETAIRFSASKRLRIVRDVDKRKLIEALSASAIELAQDGSLEGKRIVIFVRKPEDAKKIAELIRNHEIKTEDTTGKKAKTIKSKLYADSVAVLTGTMRGLERDELVAKNKPGEPASPQNQIMQRFLDGDVDPADAAKLHTVFLVSTSAGEVGFDLNADHMVCDAAPLDSMIQRLGRVNRRGKGNAVVCLVLAKDPDFKSDFDKACVVASELLAGLVASGGDADVSPKALAEFKSKLSNEQLAAASSPDPVMVELTDILLDAWSMTSITEPMPGRPEVAPWLHGIADELPQTTIAWRAELDLPGFDQLDLEDIEEWFDTHAILTHETLSVPTGTAERWFLERWDELDDDEKSTVGARLIVVDRAGLRLVEVKDVIAQLRRKNSESIRNAELIVPASFGGIERGEGRLDSLAPRKPSDEDGADDESRKRSSEERRAAPDVADERGRYRERVTTSVDGVREKHPLTSGKMPANAARFMVELETGDDASLHLVSSVSKREKLEWGSTRQSLRKHVALVRQRIDEILADLDLGEPLKLAAQLAAEYHDHGKNRERWQNAAKGKAAPPGEEWTDDTLGKSGGSMKRDPRHYRHEFGSLRELLEEEGAKTFRDSNGADITEEVIDLALHLIATHHGRGRPHFPKGGFDPDAESCSPQIHTEVMRRFGRLQRKYGWWQLAWLENLLRCADALASADDEAKKGTTTLLDEYGCAK